jgi:hypothetical protein
MNISFITICFLIVWISIVTVVMFRMVSHYNKLTQGVTSKNMREVLEFLLKKQEVQGKEIVKLQEAVNQLEADGLLHYQRLGVVRFNPFSDTGGSQSFTVAILDGKDNGIIMTSLYARTGNRWYIKHIKEGSCSDVELSKEEQSAIKKARPIHIS